MKKQKKMTLVSAVMALVVTLSTAGAATFAWFTRGTTANASGFDFTASAATGIQISTDASDWKSTIAGGDFLTGEETHPQYGNRISVSNMEPLSTVNTNITDGKLNFFGASDFDGDYQLSANTTNYLVFDLYFLNLGGEALTLSINQNSTVIDDVLNDKKTSLSTRVGFVVQGSSTERATALTLNGAVGGSAYIWEPNSLTRTSSAMGAPTNAINNAKYAYEGINSNNGSSWITSNQSYLPSDVAYSEPVTTSDIAIGDLPVVGQLPGGGNITKVKVFVWIEGQDVDCNNETSAGSVIMELGFDTGSSTGATANVLETKTATGIVSDVLTISGDANSDGVRYNAYVFAAGSTGAGAFEITYRRFVTSGEFLQIAGDITEITLDDEVAVPVGHNVVVTATFLGAIGSRSEVTLA
ncbi:MAG: hypothetical protein CVV59_01385 [Tenericutes bacterium HGW-Tenericutes-4]|nr:MAG: hypothetical protein CVV59_01385 [Tenericutes bacterium HGW-Tenericutes-4]